MAFSQRTIENFNWLLDHKIYRNETEAIDLSIIDILEQVRKSALYSNGYVAPGSGLLGQGKFEEAVHENNSIR